MATSSTKANQRILLTASGVTVLAWAVPILSLIALPLQYLNTHAHEFFHALVGIATGGHVSEIAVFASGGGVTHIEGGAFVLIASAGYIGTSILGGALLLGSRTEKGAKNSLLGLSAILALSMVLWVRADFVGVLSGVLWIGALVLMATRLSGDKLRFAAVFIGLQQCLQAIQSMLVLLHLSAYPGMTSDAGILAEATGIPALLWAVTWIGIGMASIIVGAKRSWRGR